MTRFGLMIDGQAKRVEDGSDERGAVDLVHEGLKRVWG